MLVRFKGNIEPCIVYKVINEAEVMEYAESLQKYCPHIEIEILGSVPKELLAEAKEHPHNTPAIDVAVELSK